MQPDSGYKHWHGTHGGIWSRRAVIAANGLRGCLGNRVLKGIAVLCWSSALVPAFFLFAVGQLLVPDSFIVRTVGVVGGEDLKAVADGIIAWVSGIPEVSVGVVQNILFYFYTTFINGLTLVAITIAVPQLITSDLSSNAIIVYSSKAISRMDYLIGKFCTIFGLMALTWLGPALAAWFLGNFLAPEWHFFWNSREALLHILFYIVTSMIVLSFIGMGVSAVSPNGKATVSIWLALWLVGKAFSGLAMVTQPWLKYLSFTYNLDQLALMSFDLRSNIDLVNEKLPFLGQGFDELERNSILNFDPSGTGAIIGLIVMVGVSVFIISRKVTTE